MITTCTPHAWTAPDGETFSYSRWQADSTAGGLSPRAVIIAVHGLSGAALDFEPLGAAMQAHGVAIYAVELRGQGNDPDPKRRGDIKEIEDWFADLSTFVALVRAEHAAVPIYYYGESMGAALLVRFLAQARASDQPAGLVLASPVVVVPGKPNWWQQAIFRFFLFVRPTHRIDVTKFAKPEDKNDPAKWVTRDGVHRAWFETASHRLTSFTVRFFKNLFLLIDGCGAAAPQIQVPTLLIYAANDVFIRPELVEGFFHQLGSADKELQLFPKSYHLLLHDDDKADVLLRMEQWLMPRLKARSAPAE